MNGLSLLQTERAILELKRHFEDTLADSMRLHRVSAPMYVEMGTGLQDDLSGKERPVTFQVKAIDGKKFEIVHSLAKWKRMALANYDVPAGEGIYTDMNALRPDETSIETGIHSIYVDQWDWEKVMAPEERNLDYLKETVETIYSAILSTEHHICSRYGLNKFLSRKIHFIHSEDLLTKYPNLQPKEREHAICHELGAVFLIGIGGKLANGEPHDGRAPDYDDWSTPTTEAIQDGEMPVTTIHASFWSIRQKETSFRITRTGLTTGRIISDCGKPYIWYPARTCDCMSIYCILIHGKDLRKYGALKCLPFYMASSFKEKKTIYLMIHPNGNREYFASLKCCVPRNIFYFKFTVIKCF